MMPPLPPIEAVVTADGLPVAARYFAPETSADSVRGAVLIVSAMGVGQDYYADFAHWLSRHGYAALTFDYRGMGHSRRGSLRGFSANIFDWAKLDCDAAARRLTLRCYVWWLWYVIVPLTLPLFGYFPGRRLKKVGDLPHGVMAQWRRWCLHREYSVGVEGEPVRRLFAQVTAPIVSLSFTDDEFMSAQNTASLHGFYTNAPRTMKRIAPAEAGVRRIGHFGFFRRHVAETLWATHLLPELA